mgnify:CR=1 FL=1
MNKYLRAMLAYTLSTVSGLCLLGGVAVLAIGR